MTAAQGFLRYCLTEPINEGDKLDELSATSSGKMDGDSGISLLCRLEAFEMDLEVKEGNDLGMFTPSSHGEHRPSAWLPSTPLVFCAELGSSFPLPGWPGTSSIAASLHTRGWSCTPHERCSNDRLGHPGHSLPSESGRFIEH